MTATDSSLPKSGDVIAGKYRIERLLGRGGMGAVFEVSHRSFGKRFALKWLLPDFAGQSEAIQRFLREARVAGRVDHPNVVAVYDVGQEAESIFMVMELLQGETLAARLARSGKLPPGELCAIMVPICDGLAAAHAASVVHRDLKPDNIFLARAADGGELPKLLDFGISKLGRAPGEVTLAKTRPGTLLGTPHYMAPEQLRAEAVDGRTDLYALGVILYQALAGTLPFPGDNLPDIALRILSETPRPLAMLEPELPTELCTLVERAMARAPEARPRDALELARALEAFALRPAAQIAPAADADANPAPADPPRVAREVAALDGHPRARLRWSLIAAGGLLAVSLGLGALWLASRPHVQAAAGRGLNAASAPGAAPVHTKAAPGRFEEGELPVPRTVLIAAPATEPGGAPSAARAMRPSAAPAPPATASDAVEAPAAPRLGRPAPEAEPKASGPARHAQKQAGGNSGQPTTVLVDPWREQPRAGAQ